MAAQTIELDEQGNRRIDRLDKYIRYRALNDNRVTLDSGLAVGTLGKCRKPDRDISEKTVLAITDRYTELNRQWLLSGEGEMLNSKIASKYPAYPLIDTSKAECGKAFGIIATARVTELPTISMPGIPTETEFFIQVTGHSMINPKNQELSIPNGAYVGLSRTESNLIRWGEVYAIATNDGIMLKRILQGENGAIRCISYNSDEYPEFSVEMKNISDIARPTCVVPIQLR